MVSSKFVWPNAGSFQALQETFSDPYGPQFDNAELVVMNTFENVLIYSSCETKRCAQQEISRSVNPFTIHSRIMK
jgi:hypothetical protein